MQKLIVALPLAVLGFTHSPTLAMAEKNPPVIFENVRVLSASGPTEGVLSNVLVSDSKIVKVVSASTKIQEKSATVVSGTGMFLSPGLIDSHTHLQQVPGVSFAQVAANPELKKAYFAQMPKSYLYFGYTSLIDLNVVERAAINDIKAQPLTPDIYDCDGGLILANGYPMSFLPPEEAYKLFQNFIFDERQKDKIPSWVKPGEHTALASITRVKNAGGICVKTHFERGFGKKKGLPTFSDEMFKEIVSESHKKNLPVLTHANSLEAQTFAVKNGADVLAHGLWNWDVPKGEKKSGKLTPEITTHLDNVVSTSTGIMPTMRVIHGLKDLFDESFLKNPDFAKVTPPQLLSWYKTKEGSEFKEFIRKMDADGMPDAKVLNLYKPILTGLTATTGYLAEKNAKFLFGTDTPSDNIYTNPPGLNGFLEMKQLHESGLSLKQIFSAATIDNAKAFKLDDVGEIAEGKKANLILFKQNPLTSVEAYNSISLVVIGGKVIKREALQAK